MSYKIVIADDERIICNMLAMLIHLDDLDLEIVGQAYSGEALLQLIHDQNPDIVLTDINMPTIDGIEVIRRVRESGNNCNFVVISGYREFEYVYNALKYDVKDYLLKPISEEDLNETLAKVIQQLKSRTRIAENAANTVRNYLITTGLGELELKNYSVEALNQSFCTHFRAGVFRAMIVKVDFAAECAGLSENVNFISSKISDLIERHLCVLCYDTLSSNLQYSVKCLINYAPEDEARVSDALSHILIQARALAEALNGFFVTICVSDAHSQTSEIPLAFQEAKTAQWQRLILGINRIVTYAPASASLHPFILEKLALLRKRLNSAFVILSIEDFQGSISELFALSSETLLRNEAIQLIEEIPQLFFQALSDRMTAVGNAELAKTELLNMLDMAYTLQSYKSILMEKITSLLMRIRQEIDRQSVKPIRQAIRYISENYSRTIHLEHLAAHVGLNPVYFSSLFKKETNLSFTDYMIQFRLTKAKEFLAGTNMNISEIAYQCGFSDPRYFSRLFKKVVGIKPTEYRNIYG